MTLFDMALDVIVYGTAVLVVLLAAVLVKILMAKWEFE